MIITVEISMYPLTEHYKTAVEAFILNLKKHSALQLKVGVLSTLVKGNISEIMPALEQELQVAWKTHQAVFVFKMASGDLKEEDLPDTLTHF